MMYSIIFLNHLSKINNSIIWILIVFVLSFSKGNVDNEHIDLSNLQPAIKTNYKVQGKFKHELGSKIIMFIALSPKTYSFKDYPNKTKEKGIKNCNNAKHEEYYNTLMYNTQRTVDECKRYPHDENIYLFKRDLVNKIKKTPLDLDKDQLANNIIEPNINNHKKLIEAVVRLYNDLRSSFTDLT